MANFDYDRDRKRFELNDELKADRRFRGYLIRSLREEPELTPTALQGFRINVERTLSDLDRRIALLTHQLAQFDGDDDPPAALSAA